MIENNKLIFGIGFIICGIALLCFNFNSKDYKKDNAWDLALLFKGLVGGIAAIVVGIVILFIYFKIL